MPDASAYGQYTAELQGHYRAAAEGSGVPLYLFHGNDEFLVTQGARMLAHNLVPENQRPLHLSLTAWDDEGRSALTDFCASRSLFASAADRAVLLLTDPPTASAGDLEDLLRLLEHGPPPGNVLILVVRQALPGRHPLRQTVAGSGVVVSAPELRTAPDRRDFIRRRLQHEGLRARASVIERLDWLLGGDSRAIARELRKIALYLYPDNTVTEAHLDHIVSAQVEVRSYELADAVAQGNPAQVLALLRRLEDAGVQPFVVINQLSRALRRMLQARLLLDRSLVDLQALRLGANPFARFLNQRSADLAPLLPEDPAENLLAQSPFAVYRQFLAAQAISAGQLSTALQALLHADLLLKSTSHLTAWDLVREAAVAAAARVSPPLLALSA